ncbi:MAG TPA: hypothetical protein VLA55_10365 [Ornithinibacter sp.]|nr:hypothetical protein [Ornithinibacter sp.]
MYTPNPGVIGGGLAAGGGVLAQTGFDVAGLALIGVGLVVIGLVLVRGAMLRRRGIQ